LQPLLWTAAGVISGGAGGALVQNRRIFGTIRRSRSSGSHRRRRHGTVLRRQRGWSSRDDSGGARVSWLCVPIEVNKQRVGIDTHVCTSKRNAIQRSPPPCNVNKKTCSPFDGVGGEVCLGDGGGAGVLCAGELNANGGDSVQG
ncbi:hypothetical protein Vretimale_3758, partial [Volvox reticuliferus]